MAQVVKVVPREDYRLEIELDNGDNMVLDIRPLLQKPIFKPLFDEAFFRRVKVDEFGGLEWPNGADICVDWILAQSSHREARAGTA